MAKGRKTGGKKKGYKFPQTIQRDHAKEAYRQAVLQSLQPLVQLQLAQSLGRLARTVVAEIGPGGTIALRKVSDESEVEMLASAGKGYRVVLEEPDGSMSRYITDQAIGRADAPQTSTTVTTDRRGNTKVVHEHYNG